MSNSTRRELPLPCHVPCRAAQDVCTKPPGTAPSWQSRSDQTASADQLRSCLRCLMSVKISFWLHITPPIEKGRQLHAALKPTPALGQSQLCGPYLLIVHGQGLCLTALPGSQPAGAGCHDLLKVGCLLCLSGPLVQIVETVLDAAVQEAEAPMPLEAMLSMDLSHPNIIQM